MGLPKELQKFFKEVQRMQQKIEEMQKELETREIEVQVGGGMVKVVANGRQEIIRIEIEKELINPEEKEMLEDLIVAGVNEALRKAKVMVEEELSKLTVGLSLPPGFKLPGF
jgi:DNA-binding YbaB/EbfC family protein